MIELQGKTAVVTGGGRGIGREISLTLGSYGVDVAVVDVNLESAEETVDMMEKDVGRGMPVKCDVSDSKDVDDCIQRILEWSDQIHFLVNNAGITRDKIVLKLSEEDWNKVIQVNLNGTFNVTRATVKQMIRKRYGRIVNISSVIGIMGNVGQSNYAASKAGILGFTKSIAREVAGRNITVNAIAPGFIETPMTDSLSEERKEMMRGMIPMNRFGTGRDVAGIVVFLVSDMGSYVTGQVIHCDGGMVMA
jgi:3-oxoacyl-[acyl-carrier protein] reductase